ncbi:MAG TPA: hypothetical protein VJW20_06760 [Candidatus Angelobacter sp.]|nr:hypothetical protein [Candidatus Angelobacter sp.]
MPASALAADWRPAQRFPEVLILIFEVVMIRLAVFSPGEVFVRSRVEEFEEQLIPQTRKKTPQETRFVSC